MITSPIFYMGSKRKLLSKGLLELPPRWSGISICLLSWVMIIMLVILIQSGFIIN